MPVVKSKIVSRRAQMKRPEKIVRTLGIAEFYEKRNKILVIRAVGGLGDILMHRMMFEDFKKLIPDGEIDFACPIAYHDALRDHPYIDNLIDVRDVDRSKYMISFNTTTACDRHEVRVAPVSDKHRSDIWANHCGVDLTSHNMHIRLTEEEKARGRELIEKIRDRPGPSVAIAPISAMENKNLQERQLLETVDGLHKRGCYVFGLHTVPVDPLYQRDIPTVHGLKVREWMSVIHEVDYVISVDTAAFHCAGGMGKPLVGIFTFADGEVYGKYFDFLLVQKHRNHDPEWTCGPCYVWCNCPKSKARLKPCLTEITSSMILEKVDQMFEKWPKSRLS